MTTFGSWSARGRQRLIPAAVFVGLVIVTAGAQSQSNWTVDPKSSLAWWQVNPTLGHLWATTCPEEPSWQPGAGRSAGWTGNTGLAEIREGAVYDTVHVPVYPRHRVRPICQEAVSGQVALGDTVTLRGAHGLVTVKVENMVTGESMRDEFAKNSVLEIVKYPYAKFTLDSIVSVTRRADTLRGTALGTASIHGVDRPVRAAIRAWPEAGGTRVLARFRVAAPDLINDYGLSKFALGLGITTGIWKDFFMGVDLLLRREGAGAAAPSGKGSSER